MAQVIKLNFKQRMKKADSALINAQVDSLEMSDEAREELNNALYNVTNTNSRRWVFVMINPEQFRFVTQAIADRKDAGKTLMIWNNAITYIRMDTGEIMADRAQLAKDARTNTDEVSRAMTELTKIGAIYKEKRGRKTAYFVNPNVGWAGGEGGRIEAAKGVPKLRLVAGGKVEPDGPLPMIPPVEPLLAPVIKYLRGANIVDRLKWATKAIENGAPPIEAMTDKKMIPKWAGYLLFDSELAALLPKSEEDEP
jgi:hypothetical protein